MKIALVSGLGPVIGATLAFLMLPTLSWFGACTGMVVGSLVGFIFVDLQSFRSGAASAWSTVTCERNISWFNRAQWARLGWSVLAALSLGTTTGLPFALHIQGAELDVNPLLNSAVCVAAMTLSFMIFTTIAGFASAFAYKNDRKNSDSVRDMLIMIALWFNPIGMVIAAIRGIAWFLGFYVVGAFIASTYRKTVTSARLCALLGASFGTLVGLLAFYGTNDAFNSVGIALTVGSCVGYGLSRLGARAATAKIRPE